MPSALCLARKEWTFTVADFGEGPADVLGMREEAVEVGAAESPSAEGALVDTFGEVGGVLADLQPPQHLPSLNVLILLAAADVAARHLIHIKRKLLVNELQR